MTNPHHHRVRLAVLVAVAAAARCAALTPTEWQHRQPIDVAAAGFIRVDLGTATYDSARQRLGDLRLLGPNGGELPIVIDQPSAVMARTARPTDFSVKVGDGTTEVMITTGTTENLASATLQTPSLFFLRATKVEVQQEGSDWVTLEDGVPIFREFGAEKLELALGGRPASRIRITIQDRHDPPLPFTSAILQLEAGSPPAPVPAGGHVTSREEFEGESVLTVTMDGRHTPVEAIDFETPEPVFMRRVTVTIREARDAILVERVVASGSIYRLALDGAPAQEQLELPVGYILGTREMLIHISNGDSPPLAITAVHPKRAATSVLFYAALPGKYELLSGNAQARAPRYDLSSFMGELSKAHATKASLGDIEDMPNYHPSASLTVAPLPEVPLVGVPLDVTAWSSKKAVRITAPGVQELELDPDSLARERSDFADLRLIKGLNQIPYVIERPALSRAIALAPESAPDSNRPSFSIWMMRLPEAGIPIERITLASGTTLFDRDFRILEKRPSQDGGTLDYVLASGHWSRTPQPGVPESHAFDMRDRMMTDTLWIEADNGDNPAIELASVKATYPVTRLVFKVADTGSLTLASGNPSALAPRYDIGLVGGHLLMIERNAAHFDAIIPVVASKSPFAAVNGGIVFWGALGLVVIVLLVIVAKSLPKVKA